MVIDLYNNEFVTLVAANDPPAWLVAKLQSDHSATITLCATTQDTITILNTKPLNLVIVDDALNATAIIQTTKAANSINANTPFLALIGDTGYGLRKSLIAAGYDDFLIKPFDSNDFIEAVAFWQGYDRSYLYLDSIQKLLTNCRNNRKLATTLYNKLFVTLPEQLGLIEDAFKHGDYQSALDNAHKLNGCVKTCFLLPIQPITNTLESTLAEHKHEAAEDCFLLLKQKIKTFIEQREQIIDYLETHQ